MKKSLQSIAGLIFSALLTTLSHAGQIIQTQVIELPEQLLEGPVSSSASLAGLTVEAPFIRFDQSGGTTLTKVELSGQLDFSVIGQAGAGGGIISVNAGVDIQIDGTTFTGSGDGNGLGGSEGPISILLSMPLSSLILEGDPHLDLFVATGAGESATIDTVFRDTAILNLSNITDASLTLLDTSSVTVVYTSVPVPASHLLLMLGLLGMVVTKRRRLAGASSQ